MQTRSTLFSLAIVISATAPVAQCPSSLSFLAGAPTGISLDQNPANPFDATELYFNQAGLQSAAPNPWPATPTGVGFRIRDRLLACGSNPPPDINAMSIGQDWILADDNTGRIQMPNNRWAVINFSVSPNARGRDQSRIRTESNSRDGAGADIFTYVLPGSALPAEIVDRTFRSQDSTEINVGSGNPGSQRRSNVDAIDNFMALYGLDRGMVATLPQRPTFFFTVSRASLPLANPGWFRGTTPSAASILRMDRISSTAGWSCPTLYKAYSDLGLNAGDDVDALAIDLFRQRILYSTTDTTVNQIQFIFCGGNDTAVPVDYADDTGTPVTQKIGLLDDDDVDGLCGIDPSIRRGQLTAVNTWHYFHATPTQKVFPYRGTLGACAWRTRTPGGQAIFTQLVGWPPVTGPGPGIALCTFSPPNQFGPLVSLSGQARNVAPLFCGDPRTFTLPIPAALTIPNFEFDLRWFVADSMLTEIHDAHPLRVILY